MLRLPKEAIEGLVKVMQAVEESLALPTQICVNDLALLGKPNGAGERAITLTGASTPHSWPATKMKRAFGMTPAMDGGTTQ